MDESSQICRWCFASQLEFKTLTHEHLKICYQRYHNYAAANSWDFQNTYDILYDERTQANKNAQLITDLLTEAMIALVMLMVVNNI